MTQIHRQQNLKVSYQYIAWILETNRAIMGHLYKFTSATGVNDFFTDLDVDINYDLATWKSTSLRFEGLQRKVGIGLNVDEQTLKIWAAPEDTLFGANFLSGAEEGLLDGAVIARYRAIWNFITGNASIDVQKQPLVVFPLFTGYTSQITKGGASHVEMKVKSALVKLNVNMPQNYFQPGCGWTLYDSGVFNPDGTAFVKGCTLLKAHFAVTGTIGAAPTLNTIPIVGGISSIIGADGIAQYAQGRLLFTSGVNNGLQVLISTNNAVNLYLAYPLNALPSTGDTVTYYPGCSKSYNTCQTKFANQANFRGFDKVPPIVLSV